MAAKKGKKTKKGAKKKAAAKKAAGKKKNASKKAPKKPAKKAAVKIKQKRRRKCCVNCPDYEYCDDRGYCCDYCDYYLNGKCMHGKKKGIPSVNQEIELPDYRGDDYGIDDYEAYEAVYE